jgi:tetratricopeptide (TPR) repeat protein
MAKFKFISSLKTLFFLLTFPFLSIFANENLSFNAENDDEALFLRRIADFWQDEEFEIAKSQINSFLETYPNSNLKDSLYAILGNIYLNEKKHFESINAYDNIKDETIKDKISINLLSSLLNTSQFDRLSNECEAYIKKTHGELKDKISYLQAIALFQIAEKESDVNIKNNSYKTALLKFQNILETNFEMEAREYISQIHFKLKDYISASNTYIDLASKNPTKEDEYLFQAAMLQTNFDKEKALETFSKISQNSTSKKEDAAYNKTLLLFELAKYETLIKEKDFLIKSVSEEKKPLINFFVGRSYFILKNYAFAKDNLINSLEMADKNSIQMKLALIMLMQCSYELNDFDLYNNSFDIFISYFPNDEKLFEALFARALLNKRNDKLDPAKNDFEKIFENFQNAENNPLCLFEYAHLLYLKNDIDLSREKFKKFVVINKEHELIKPCLNYLINCSIKAINSSNDFEKEEKRKNLTNDINYALEFPSLFSNKEKNSFKLLLSKTYFDLKDFEKSLSELTFLEQVMNDAKLKNIEVLTQNDLSELYLIKGYCLKYLNNNLNDFINLAEKSLEINPLSQDNATTYINLYNSYLNLSKNEDKIDENYLSKAANCLYNAYILSKEEIDQSNLVWLANYYYLKTQNYLNLDYKNNLNNEQSLYKTSAKSKEIFEYLVSIKDTTSEIEKLVQIEPYLVRISNLYKYQNNLSNSEEILINLVTNYKNYPNIPWKYKEEAIYNLALIYDSIKDFEKASNLYNEFLITFNKDSYFKPRAYLHHIRILLSKINKEDYTFQNKSLENILAELKTISLQKVFANEPVHLEAAFDYIDTLFNIEKIRPFEKKLFLLTRMKENFTREDDLVSQDYQAMRRLELDKETIYKAYLMMVDIEILICSGYIENRMDPIINAKELLVKMKNESLITTMYLDNRLKNNFKLIEGFKN